jgi:hypothetical protein
MKSSLCLIFSIVMLLGTSGSALAAQDTKEVMKVYDAYLAAVKSGNADRILGYYSAQQQQDIGKSITKKDQRKDFIMMARFILPESYEVKHSVWSRDGKKANIYIEAQLPALPEFNRGRTSMEAMLRFVKENSGWKIDIITPLADLGKIRRSKDLSYNEDEANREQKMNIGGRIVFSEYKDNYTIAMLRVMETEVAVFLPPRKVLLEAGVLPDDLKPWGMYEFDGNPHKSDDLKFFATGGKPIIDEP